jgi:hypothetical protein
MVDLTAHTCLVALPAELQACEGRVWTITVRNKRLETMPEVLSVVLDGLAKILNFSYAMPRFPYAAPPPARLPTFFVIARSSLWYVMDLEKPPIFRYALPRMQ